MAALIVTGLLARFTPDEAARAVERSPYLDPGYMRVRVNCAGCHRLVEAALEHDKRMYGMCCWEKVRSAAASGWRCEACDHVLPEEDMETVQLCRRCAGVSG